MDTVLLGKFTFEDNAEFGLGMKIATENTRHRIEHIMNESMQEVPNALSALFKD